MSKTLADNCPKLKFKLFQAIFEDLKVKPLTTSEYHSKANEQVECFSIKIVPRLWRYVAEP